MQLWQSHTLCKQYFENYKLSVHDIRKLYRVSPPPPPPPKKAERSVFVILTFENTIVTFFLFHQIKHCLLKRMIPRSLKFVEYSFDSMVISQNIVIVKFIFILVTFQSRIMAFLTSIHCCPKAQWSVQTKERENVWTAIPAVNSSRRFNKIRKWLCFKK